MAFLFFYFVIAFCDLHYLIDFFFLHSEEMVAIHIFCDILLSFSLSCLVCFCMPVLLNLLIENSEVMM